MSKWHAGLYEDDQRKAFIGIEGASICAVDELTTAQASAIVGAHNHEVAQLEAEKAALKKKVEYYEDIKRLQKEIDELIKSLPPQLQLQLLTGDRR